MSKPYNPGPRSLRRYCTPQRKPVAESRPAPDTPPVLPATERQALHALSRRMAWHCDTAWEYDTRASYLAHKPWQTAAQREREVIDARLKRLTDGR